MTAKELRKKLEKGTFMITFIYNGKVGDVDPWYDKVRR